MKPTRRDLVDRFFVALQDGDIATAQSLVRADVIIEEPEELPYGGTYHGIKGFYEIMTYFSTGLSLSIHKVEAFEADGRGFGMIEFSFTAADGSRVDTTSIDLVEFDDQDLITRIRPHVFRPHAVQLLHESMAAASA